MYEKVLVTLDGSEMSEAVLPHVERLTAGTETQVTLLRAVEPPEVPTERVAESVLELASPSVRFGMPPPVTSPPTARDEEKREQAFERVEHKVKAYLEERAQALRAKGVKVETAVRFGDDPADTIIDYAHRQDVDLIMMTTHGRTGLARAIFGSVAGRIVKSGVRPVLLVRPEKLEG